MSLLESLLAKQGLTAVYRELKRLDLPVLNSLLALPEPEFVDPLVIDQLVTSLGNLELDPSDPDPVALLAPVLAVAIPVLASSGLLSATDGSDILFSGIPGLGTLLETPGAAAGRAGNDVIIGGNGIDLIDGGAGNDVIYGDSLLVSELLGRGGNDILSGGDGNDKLFGQIGDDILLGGNGNDSLYGGAGSDTLVDTAGNDLLDGGAGIDTVLFASTTTDLIKVNLTTGVASGVAIETDKLVSIENVTILGLGPTEVIGNASANVITGGFGADTISGEAGNDILSGGLGADQIMGGAGNDTLTGGLGADQITGGAGSDLLVYGNLGGLADSGLLGIDTVTGFDFGAGGDKFRFDDITLTSTSTQTVGTVGSFLFLGSNTVTSRNFAADSAKLLTVTGGSNAGDYLVVDGNSTAGYQAGADFIIKLVGSANIGSFDLNDLLG